MKTLKECINMLKYEIDTCENGIRKDLFNSIYYHLSDYSDILDKTTDLYLEIEARNNRWAMLEKNIQLKNKKDLNCKAD